MNWQELISSVMYVVITVIVPMVGVYIKSFLQAKIDILLVDIKNEKTRVLIEYAVEAIQTSVDAVSQTYVSALKAEGKFDNEAHEKAKALAVDKAKLLIAQESKEAISVVYGDFDAYLDDKIEAYLFNGKK